jgi:hypothetical protein
MKTLPQSNGQPVRRYRPTDQATVALIADMVRQGWSVDQMAAALRVTPRTLKRWYDKHQLVQTAVSRNHPAILDANVEEAMYNLATGYTTEQVEETLTRVPTAEGETELICTERKVKRQTAAPDRQAAQFWLKNRRPERWTDRQEHDVRGAFMHLVLDPVDQEL